MPRRLGVLAISFGRVVLGAVTLAAPACSGERGGGVASPPTMASGVAVPSAEASSGRSSPSAPPAVTTGPSADVTAPAAPAQSARIPMKPLAPSTLLADLSALGLDPNNLPPMEKLDPKTLRGTMKLMARSLGGVCRDCHLESNFAAPTPRKRIAAKMWNEFVVKLSAADGSPLFCDSCHQGRIQQLDRTDIPALRRFMVSSFVEGLRRRDGQEHGCETCHGTSQGDLRFLRSWAAGTR